MIVGKDINMDDINHLMDTSNSLFNFKLTNTDYDKVKKMSSIDSKDNDVLIITVEKNNLYIGEIKWKLKVCDNIGREDYTYTFPKRYFNTISTTTDIDIYVYDTYILTKYDDYNLLVVLETSV